MTVSVKLAQGDQKTMTSGFPHQNPLQNFSPLKSTTLPQHGQQPDKALKPKPDRVTTPRPGH